MKIRHRVIVEVHLVLRRLSETGAGQEVLFGRRHNTGYADGMHNLPSGHLDPGESTTEAMIREAREELALELTPQHLQFAHVMHKSCEGGRIGYFFTAEGFEGQPVNNEPEKCSGLDWLPAEQLPDSVLDYTQLALSYIAKGSQYSTYTCIGCCGDEGLSAA